MDLRKLFEKIYERYDEIPAWNRPFIDSLRDQFARHKWLTKNQIRELIKICKRHGITKL